MRIQVTLTPPGGTAFLLADDSVRVLTGRNWPAGAGGSMVDGFPADQEAQVQEQPLFRAANPLVIPRYNWKNTFPLKVKRTFDTETNAIWFMATHADSVPAQGLLTVNVSTSDSKISLFLANAVRGKISRQKHTGVTFFYTYQITGNGPWLTAAP